MSLLMDSMAIRIYSLCDLHVDMQVRWYLFVGTIVHALHTITVNNQLDLNNQYRYSRLALVLDEQRYDRATLKSGN